MKLVYKNILFNAFVSVLILLIGEYSLYYFLKGKIEKETIEHLHHECHAIKRQLKKGVNIEVYKYNIGDFVEIEPIEKIQYQEPVIKDVEAIEEEEEHEGHKNEEHFSSKIITFDVSQNDKNYRVSILKTIDEDEGLTDSMSAIIFISGLSMLFILLLVNVFVYYKLFSPVYRLIKDVKGFTVNQLKKISPLNA